MRLALKIIGSKERHVFIGTYEKEGLKNNKFGTSKTVLLRNIKDDKGKYLCDHLWFNKTKGFRDANLRKGDIVSFNGRVSSYVKGYSSIESYTAPFELDYEIVYPTKVKVIKNNSNNKIQKKLVRKKVKYRYSHLFKTRKKCK